jgi:sugar lactone lactonase YvrE
LFFRDDLPPLVITGDPVFTPSSTVVSGTSVSMVVSASGTPPYTYQWLKDGNTITGATSGTHTINPVAITDAGDYSVIVNDLKNIPATSGTATLTVVELPEILTQPTGATVLKGAPATFTVSATCGASAMAWQWFHGDTAIPGANAATYVIPAVIEADAGAYSVKISNADHPAYFVTSAPATLTVSLIDILNAPVIADFNDHVVSGLSNNDNTGTGIGFDMAENKWPVGTSVIVTRAFDLTAPPATRYGFTQDPATPRSVTAINADNAFRFQTRLLATPLTGQIWGSFLVENRAAANQTGIVFNYPVTGFNEPPNRCRIGAEGASLVVYSSTVGQGVTVPDVFTLGQTALVLFSYDTGTQRLRIWINPVLPDTAAGIDAITPVVDATLDLLSFATNGTDTGKINRIGPMARAGINPYPDSSNGFLDALRLASGADGYYRVTGIVIPPVIIEHPRSSIVALGAPASFTVSATGVGPLAYQWLHGGSAIPTGTAATLTVDPTVREDHGQYEVVVSHAAGAGSVVSKSAALIFSDEKVPLEILSFQLIPSSGTVHTGAAVSLIVSATGTVFDNEPVTYQWLRDGAEIAGATSGTLTLDPATTADTGAYSVRVDDAAREPIVSGTLSLAVIGAPIILEQPAGQTVAGRTPVTLSVTATSVSPILYQWLRDGAEIPGATAADYHIASAQPSDSGDYSARLTNADFPAQYVTLSATATLAVLPLDRQDAPVVADFNDHAAGLLAATLNTGAGFQPGGWDSGGSSVINVTAEDLSAPAATRYAITQTGDPRSIWGNNADPATMRMATRLLATPLSGEIWGSFLVSNGNATSRTGVVFNLTPSSSGAVSEDDATNVRWLYARGVTLVVRDGDGQERAAVPRVFTLGQTALVLFAYDSAAQRLRVWVDPVLPDAVEDLDALTPTYDSGGAAATPLDLLGIDGELARIGILVNGGQSSAATAGKLDSLRLSSGPAGYAHVTGMFVPPVITTQPAASTIVNRGAPATLTVAATGVGPLLYQWTFWDAPIPGATGSSLTIPGVQVENQGKYRVIVRNDGGAGSAVSDLAVVLIREDMIPFAITRQPSLNPSTVEDGTPVSLSVAATGTPPLEYQWRKDGAAIPGATAGAFSIPVARVADSGDYDVEITDLSREKITSATVPLRVQTRPSIITQPQDAVSHEGGPVSFVVEARGTDITYRWTRNGADIAGAATATLTLNNLTAADNGAVYTVIVSNGVSSVESAPATLTVRGPSNPPASGDIASTADATIENGASAPANLNASGLLVAAPGTADGARKSYLAFDLPPAVESADATGASLTLTLGSEPFIATGGAAAPPNNPVRLRLHGIVSGNDVWAEDTITWNNAPASAGSQTAPGIGAIPLAELTLDVAARAPGDTVTFADPRIAQFLNWAAGRRGDLYGNGRASDPDHKVTFVLTSIDAGADFAGVRFADKEAGAAAAPKLSFDTTGAAGAAGATSAASAPTAAGATSAPVSDTLENERYTVTLAAGLGVDVTDKTTGATKRFTAAFEVVHNAGNPEIAYAAVDNAATGSPQFTLPTWKTDPALSGALGARAHDYGAAEGTRTWLTPHHAVVSDGRVVWRFAPADVAVAGFFASLELPAGADAPRLRWTLSPATSRYYAVSFTGLPEVANAEVDSFYMPGIWDARRFPDKQYVIDEIRATTPAVLRRLADESVTAGVAVDPFEIPNRVSTRANGGFGLAAGDFTAANSAPAVIAPLYGAAGSLTDGSLSFSVRLVVSDDTLDATIRDVVTGIYGFRDYRRNLDGGSLNTALDNLVDFLLTEDVDPTDNVAKGYSHWRANDKANEYVNDAPTDVRFQSAATALALALVRDDADYYEKRALPSIEYFMSRRGDTMPFDSYDPDRPMGGPVVSYYSTDFFALLALTGGRTSAFATLADQAWAESFSGATSLLEVIGSSSNLTKTDAYNYAFSAWHSLIAGYRATGRSEYLADARVIADNYIRHRYTGEPASDFDDVKNSFWNQISGRWESLLEMYDLTGDAAYAEHAAKAMDEFVRHIQFAPGVNDLTVDGKSATTPAVKSMLVSEVGLVSEASATSHSHRGIFMGAYAAPSLMRVAGLTTDPFYAAVSRSAIIGRWLNYPGYAIRDYYYADLLRADYPLRWYSEYINTAHMNHPASLASMTIDYLMADAEYKSQGAIRFPHQFSDSKAYFRGRIYGGAPGEFHGETGIWPWLPRGLVSLSGANAVQLNYIAGHGNGRFYLAFSNQSVDTVTATITVRAGKVQFTPGARMRVWADNVPQNHGVFENGVTSITVSPGGITAIAIDDAAAQLDLQAGHLHGNGTPLPPESFSQRMDDDRIGDVTGAIISLSPDRQSAYVYTNAAPTLLQSATLVYSIDGGPSETLAKDIFPFEFSVPLPADAQYFTYSITGIPAGGGAEIVGGEATLYLTPAPVITRHPAAQAKTTGDPVLFTIQTDDPGGEYQYQWFQNGVPIPGAQSSSLGFICATTDDGNIYHVVVSKGRINIISTPATLTVTPKPDLAIITQPAAATLAAGTPYVLEIVAENATAYQWYKNIPPAQPVPGATSATLRLSGAESDSGNYYVIVYGLIGGAGGSIPSNMTTVTFTPIAGVPVITEQPQGKAVTTGTPFTLSVAATGAVSHQWYHDGTAISGATSPTLNLHGAQSDNGVYYVVISNGAGNKVSETVMVSVLPPPQIIASQPAGGLVQYGSNYTLSVEASDGATYQWRKDGIEIPGATSSTLILSGSPSDAGVYDVIVTAPAGAVISSAATITIAPDPDSRFAQSSGIAINAAGLIYIADATKHIIQTIETNATSNTVTTYAGIPDSPGTLDGARLSAKFNQPSGLVERSGTLYIVDTGNNSIRVIDTAGMVSTLFASTNADITQRLNAPADIAIDTSGNLYIADSGNHVIRKITATGSITTLAGVFSVTGTTDGNGPLAEFNTPVGIALNEVKGELYIADSGNHAIRTLDLTSGSVGTLAGQPGVYGSEDGPASLARFNAPGGLIVDPAGDIYLADTGNSLIRKIAPTGEVTTIAGYPGIDELAGVPGFKDGQGINAWFNHPETLALSPDGTLIIADSGNLAIRTIDPSDTVTTLTVTSTTTSTTAPPPVPPGDNNSGGSGGGGASSLCLFALLCALACIRRLYKKQ